MENQQGLHHMGRRSQINNYHKSGTYHITIRTNALFRQPLGQVTGDINKPDGDPDAPPPASSLSPLGSTTTAAPMTRLPSPTARP